VKAYRGEELEYPDPGEDGSSGTYRDLTETKVAEFATKWVAYQIDGALSQWKLLAPQFDFNTDERLQHMLAKAAADAVYIILGLFNTIKQLFFFIKLFKI
jgi:hypothetical protein